MLTGAGEEKQGQVVESMALLPPETTETRRAQPRPRPPRVNQMGVLLFAKIPTEQQHQLLSQTQCTFIEHLLYAAASGRENSGLKGLTFHQRR